MATGKIANLSVGVSVDAAEFTNGLSKAQAEAEKFAKTITTKSVAIGVAIGQNIGDAAKELATAFPRAFAAAVDSMDAFNDLRDATSASIENISALDSIGRKTGATFEDVSGALTKFNKSLGDAGDNVKGDIFRELGLDIAKLKREDPAEAFRQTAVALAGVENNAQKSQVLLELFGKSAAAIAPFLQDVGEAGELVATVTEDQAAAAEKYNKALFQFKAEAEDAMRVVASDMLPALTEIVKALGDGGNAVSAFGSIVGTVFETVTVVASDTAFVFKGVGREIGAWAAQIGALATGDLQGFSAISDAVKEDGRKARLELDDFQRRLLNSRKTLAEMGVPEASYSNEGRSSKPAAAQGLTSPEELEKRRKAQEEAAKAQAKAAEAAASAQARAEEHARKYIDALDKQIFKAQHLSEVEKVAEDIARGRVKFTDAAMAGSAIEAAAAVDASKRLAAQLEEEAKVWESVQRARQDAAVRINESVMSDWDKYTAKVKEAQDLHAQNLITTDTLKKYVDQLGDAYAAAGQKAKESTDEQSEAAKEAERNIQSSLGSELARTLQGDFDNIGKRFGALVANMVAQAAAADLASILLGKGASSGASNLGGLFGAIGNLFGVSSQGSGSWDYDTGGWMGDGTAHLATGTNYVPYDGFKATLHEGEAVVPKKYNPSAGGYGNQGASFFQGQVINVGAGVSLPQVRAEVNAANSRSEARIRRSLEQQKGR